MKNPGQKKQKILPSLDANVPKNSQRRDSGLLVERSTGDECGEKLNPRGWPEKP